MVALRAMTGYSGPQRTTMTHYELIATTDNNWQLQAPTSDYGLQNATMGYYRLRQAIMVYELLGLLQSTTSYCSLHSRPSSPMDAPWSMRKLWSSMSNSRSSLTNKSFFEMFKFELIALKYSFRKVHGCSESPVPLQEHSHWQPCRSTCDCGTYL